MYFICRIEFMLLGVYAAAIFLKHMFVLKIELLDFGKCVEPNLRWYNRTTCRLHIKVYCFT